MASFDVLKAASEHRAQENTLRWEGTFAEYLDKVRENPKVADLAHARLYDMVMSGGVEEQADGKRTYKTFEGEIFGLEKTLTQLVEEYLSPASRRLDIRKRILMHEEPLHLIPHDLRDEFRRDTGLYIEGDLCPVCRYRLEHEWNGDIGSVPLHRITLSERDRIGVGTFKPADPKSQDVAELTGSVNIQALAELGAESDPRVYNFDGELNIANRGVMEFIETKKTRQ